MRQPNSSLIASVDMGEVSPATVKNAWNERRDIGSSIALFFRGAYIGFISKGGNPEKPKHTTVVMFGEKPADTTTLLKAFGDSVRNEAKK